MREDGTKQPYFVRPKEGMLFAAALWSEGLGRLSCTMITTESVEPLNWLHQRLPRFLTPGEARVWCEGTAEEAAGLLEPSPPELCAQLVWSEADPAVGRVGSDHRGLIGLSDLSTGEGTR